MTVCQSHDYVTAHQVTVCQSHDYVHIYLRILYVRMYVCMYSSWKRDIYVHQSVQRTGRSSLNLKVVVATASVYRRKQLVCCSVHTSLHRSTAVLRTVVVPPLLWTCVWIMWSVVSLVRMFWYGALHKHKCTDRCQHATLLYGTEM